MPKTAVNDADLDIILGAAATDGILPVQAIRALVSAGALLPDGGLATGRERAPDRLRRFGLALLSVLPLTGWEPRPAATRVEV